jgi:hypothetical protein
MTATTPAVAGQVNPGTLGTDFNVLSFVIQQILQNVQTASLVQIISCTNTGGLSPVGRVVVQPLVFQMTGTLQLVPHGEINDVPYLRIQGGTNAIILDPQPGDIGLAVFCSRDIANVKLNPVGAVAAGGAAPGSFGSFDWADGLYLGGFLNGLPTQYVQFSPAGITINSSTAIQLTAESITLTAPTVDINASTSVTVTTPTMIVSGTLTGGVVKTAAGRNLDTHIHTPGTYEAGSTPVTGDSGAPV